MDDLLREFLTETSENLDRIDMQLVRFEQEPSNARILDNIFRLVHTIKGTCGFIGLPRLEALAHAAEALMGKFRDGLPATSDAVTLILATIDRLKLILDRLEATQAEPEGSDGDLIDALDRMAGRDAAVTPFNETTAKTAPASPLAMNDDAELVASPETRVAGQSIRVNVDTLETLMTMVSELVLTRNQLLDLVRRHDDSEFKVPLQRLSTVTAELHDSVMKTRMQPVGHAWQKLPRLVRDLAAELGKEIDLEMNGAETELDRQVIDLIKDPLTHMIRNSADHGLELSEERVAVGKPAHGTIRLSATHEGGTVVISVSDDGRGLDSQAIRRKVAMNGLASEVDLHEMTDAQIHRFIFAPGFSTAAAVTNVSGRGVGMDVVRSNIEQIGGSVDVKSVAGEGTHFTIKIPLTLAIVPALIVEAAGERFAIPQVAVIELVRAKENSAHRIERIKDTQVLRLRDRLLPLLDLADMLQLDHDAPRKIDSQFIVVMQAAGQNFGIVVHDVLHTEDIVVKPMSSKLRHVSLLAGNTILGDGTVIMILDPNRMMPQVGMLPVDADKVAADEVAQTNAIERTALLLFRAGSPAQKAVPLSLITRLEEIDTARVEMSDGRPMIQYRDRLMPLVEVGGARLRSSGRQPILVFTDGARAMGLVIDEIIDIAEEHLDIEIASAHDGVLGAAVIRGHATEIIDVAYFLPKAFADWFERADAQPAVQSRAVLLVDDSAFFRNMLEPVLKAAGYRVSAAAHAREALDLALDRLNKGTPFDVVLTDIEMPDIDGFQLAEIIRADQRLRSLPVLALSSHISPAALERGRQAGFRGHIAKFDRPGLIAALREQAALPCAA
jgi:two-component system, chemotaxis family, sensor kinase CheA